LKFKHLKNKTLFIIKENINMEVKSISDIKSIEHFKDTIEHKQYLLQIYREYINKLSNLAELATEYRLITTKVLENISKYADDVSNNEIIVNYNVIDEDNQIEQLDIELESEVKPKTKKASKKTVIEQQQLDSESIEQPKAKLAKTTKKVISEPASEPIVEEKPKAKKTTKKVTSEEPIVEPIVEPVSEPIVEEKPKAKKTTKKVTSEEPVIEPVSEPKAKLAKTTKKVISEPIVEPISEPIVEEKPKAKKTTKKVILNSTE
jgi:hypothetical protein